ncbi:MAG: preQ(1) synthase [Chloroflexota bacterium]
MRDKYAARRFDTQGEEAIDGEVLETLPFEYPGSATEVIYETDEFTSVCPWTGLPDFAHLLIKYAPHNHLVELKSLKYYLISYRNVGILQEHAVNRILNDLVRLLNPHWLEVVAEFQERGGLGTKAVARYQGHRSGGENS